MPGRMCRWRGRRGLAGERGGWSRKRGLRGGTEEAVDLIFLLIQSTRLVMMACL